MSISQKQLARELGVSVATISRVLNGKDNIAEDTRRRVENALRESGYFPDPAARSLKTRRTHTVGILVPDITEVLFGSIIKRATRTLEASGYGAILCDSDEKKVQERYYLDYLASRRVDGLILASLGAEPQRLIELKQSGIALVQIDNLVTEAADAVLIDNVRAGEMGIERLISCGRKRIGVIAGNQKEYTGRRRLEGCIRAAKSFGAELEIREGNFKENAGRAAMESLLDANVRPDAVFIHSSKMTYGALSVLRERGLSYPHDIGILGFDVRDPYGIVTPPLSSIVQPEADIGEQAAMRLVAAIEGKPTPQTAFMQPELLERESE